MNEQTQLGLKVPVERAVRPIDALLDRTKPMCEELLDQVTVVCAEKDEEAALAATAKRFGDPTHIASELQHAVRAY